MAYICPAGSLSRSLEAHCLLQQRHRRQGKLPGMLVTLPSHMGHMFAEYTVVCLAICVH